MATIDIMLPVYNEAKSLTQGTTRLREYLDELHLFTHTIQIVIVDNASTDETQMVGRRLANDIPGISYLRLECKGRGHALKTAWANSTADVVAYMDIDLSTSLSHLSELLWPLLNDVADVSFGSRLASGSLVAGRSTQREFLSRNYNRLLRFTMNAAFTDAQCGFKAVRREILTQILPQVQDDNWFFDTELLLLMQYNGYRLREIPVVWLDDPSSTVNVRQTVIEDLHGMVRIFRSERPYSALHRVTSFSIIGMITTIGYALMYWLLAMLVPDQTANLFTLSTMTLLNIYLNRRYTYRRYGREHLRVHYGAGFGAFLLTWVITGGGLWLLQGFYPAMTVAQESVTVTLLSLLGTTLKYFIYGLIFRDQKPAHNEVSDNPFTHHKSTTQPLKELA